MNRLLISLLLVAMHCMATEAGAVMLPESVRNVFSGRVCTPVEAVRQITDGAVIAIIADDAVEGSYDVICVDSPDLRLAPGTSLGNARMNGGDGRSYILDLFTDIARGGVLCARKKFEVTITSDGFMEMKAVKRFSINMWLVYRFFVTISTRQAKAPEMLKARRIYPNPVPSPDFPVVL